MTPDRSDDGVLEPEDLSLDPEHVERIEENRFVVKPDESDEPARPSRPENALGPAKSVRVPNDDGASATNGGPGTTQANLTDVLDGVPGGSADGAAARERSPTDVLAADPAPHGVDISLKTDGEVARHRSTSNDVREVFADMMAWYANQLDEDVTPMQALEVLVATTNLDERA